MSSIPVVPIGTSFDAAVPGHREAAETLCAALSSIGFAYIVDHSVPQALVDKAFDASREFHASPQKLKESIRINEYHRGYMGLATSTIVTSSVATVTKPNLSESLLLMHEVDRSEARYGQPLQGPNQWPDWTPNFRSTIETYIQSIDVVARQVVRMIAVGLGLEGHALDRYFVKPTTFLRLLHYPPQPPDSPQEQYGSAPHTDYGIITVLAQDNSGGLQVRPRGGDWIEASPIRGSFVLNVADMLARWTNNRFVSTPHRVINRTGRDRYSLPYFFDSDMDAMIECLPSCTAADNPPRYQPVRYGDYLIERLNKNYDYRNHPAPSAHAMPVG